MFKLANNAVYGKTMQDVRNQQSYKFVSDEKMNSRIKSIFFKDFDLVYSDGKKEISIV
jgi:hypothetical protein